MLPSPLALLLAWSLDLILGDPVKLPHPVVGMGRAIAFAEHRLNRGGRRRLKGAVIAVTLIIGTFVSAAAARQLLTLADDIIRFSFFNSQFSILTLLFDTIFIYYCLAGTTLVREVRAVFDAVERSCEEGRKQVARIVGRDTSQLSPQEIRTAALETLAENLSDGVVAPLFWLGVAGVPGMLAYKMINTLDSMIGYRTSRYKEFGFLAAKIDDIANYIPARITALLMIAVSFRWNQMPFLIRNARRHASPNSGWPEAALAGILDCRFGGSHSYFGETIDKPFIGTNERTLSSGDLKRSVIVCRGTEILTVILTLIWLLY